MHRVIHCPSRRTLEHDRDACCDALWSRRGRQDDGRSGISGDITSRLSKYSLEREPSISRDGNFLCHISTLSISGGALLDHLRRWVGAVIPGEEVGTRDASLPSVGTPDILLVRTPDILLMIVRALTYLSDRFRLRHMI